MDRGDAEVNGKVMSVSSDWVVEFQKIMFRIALVNAKLEELRKVKVRCDCPWVDWRIKDLERELKSLRDRLERLKER